ncbi:hypothetical protein EV128_109225 [Rhizobium azibense]|nr:hypothetical protein EV128_109225 [Rhizobium azibense]
MATITYLFGQKLTLFAKVTYPWRFKPVSWLAISHCDSGVLAPPNRSMSWLSSI